MIADFPSGIVSLISHGATSMGRLGRISLGIWRVLSFISDCVNFGGCKVEVVGVFNACKGLVAVG